MDQAGPPTTDHSVPESKIVAYGKAISSCPIMEGTPCRTTLLVLMLFLDAGWDVDGSDIEDSDEE